MGGAMPHLDDLFSCSPVWQVPDPCIVVELPNGIELMGQTHRGVEYTLSSWDGWTNGPEVRGGADVWENADGGTPGDVYLSGLNLAFEGLIRGRSATHLQELQAELGSLLTRERWGTLRVHEDHLGLSRQVDVARGGRPTITPLSQKVARYSVQLQSASPYRLDVDLQSAVVTTGGTALLNIGNVPAALTLHLAGPLTNPGISWPGGAWQYSGSIGTNNMISVDLERRVVRNPATTVHSRRLASGSWLSLPPGTTTVARTGTGNGTITARWRSSWA